LKSFREYLNERYLMDLESKILEVVSTYLDDKASETEQLEPYATHSIERYRAAAQEVRQIEFDENNI